MARIIVVGAGFAGCGAAAAARKAGAQVTLLDKMELLGGWGLFAGRVDYKYFTVREELRHMGDDFIFQVLDDCTLHENVHFPWPKPGATKKIYDVSKLDPALRKYLGGIGVEVRVQSRVKNIEMDGKKIKAVILDDRTKIRGDAFVDATGGSGPPASCRKYGNGCVMCLMRCPALGNRVSIAEKAGVKELVGKKRDGSLGPMTAAYSLVKETLDPELREELERKGVVWIPVPSEVVDYKRTESITASGNIDKGFAENICLVDIGAYAKRIAGGYTPLDELRRIPGLEQAMYADPMAGTLGNAIRYLAITPRSDALDVPGAENLFVAGEKLGINGIGECIATGIVAGQNAVRKVVGMNILVIPRTTMLGDFIAYVNERWDKEEGLRSRYHLYAEPYISRAEKTGLYTESKDVIDLRIDDRGLRNVLSRQIVS
jgi:hypothetical protein